MQHPTRRLAAATGLALLLAAGPGRAEPWNFLGPRYQGMGGAGVAVVDDDHAPYWNPGALGFRGSWDLGITAGAQAAAEGDVLDSIDRVVEFIDGAGLDAVLDDVAAGGALSDADLQGALGLAVERLPELGRSGQGLLGSAGAGIMARIGRTGLSAIGIASFAAAPVFDLTSLSFNTAGSAADQIANAFGTSPPPGVPANQGLADSIAAVFESAGLAAGDAQNAADNLVYQAETAGIDTSDPAVASLIDDIAGATATLGAGDLSENASGAFVRGAVTAEEGVALGYTLPIPVPGLENRIGIGANLKYIFGTTYAKFFQYDDVAGSGDVLNELLDTTAVEHTHTWGVDLGMLFAPAEWLRVGVTARNVNGPELEMRGPGDYQIAPQVRSGVAVTPLPGWVIAADLDLTENRSEALPGFRSRTVSAGTELAVPLGPVRVALRAGLYTNLASDAANALAITAGLGLRLWNLHLDLAGGASPHTTKLDFDGASGRYPTRANLALALRWAGRF